jgi:hypothetical protein
MMDRLQQQQQTVSMIYSKLLLEDLQSRQSHIVMTALEYLSGSFSKSGHEYSHGDNCQAFCRLGGHGVLLVVMTYWKEHAAIQSSCCDCIGGLFHKCHKDVTEAFLDLGLVELLMGALERFPHAPSLHYRANKVLKYLDIKCMVADHDGITMVLTIMTKFPQVASLQELCCRFFQTSLQLGLVTAAEIRTRALVDIAKAVKVHPNHPGIQKSVSIIVKRVSR